MRINTLRTMFAGIVAGATRIVGQRLLDVMVLLASSDTEATPVDPTFARTAASPSFTAGVVVIQFLIGIATVYVYIATRSRFGATPRTAIMAGFIMWTVGAMLWSLTVMAGLVPLPVFLARASASLPIALIAALVGARLCPQADDAPLAEGERLQQHTKAV